MTTICHYSDKDSGSKMGLFYQSLKFLLFFPLFVKAQDSPTVCNDQGTCFKGSWLETEIATFQGIRFAEPPVGENRFKPPIPINQSNLGTVDASEISSVKCPQHSDDFLSMIGQEDCLLINVYVPKGTLENTEEKIPVMFWIYGGALIEGNTI